MFHLPVSMLGGGNGNDVLALPISNNENLIHQHNNSKQQQQQHRTAQKPSGLENYETNKTPGATKSNTIRRRALGDISNKKQNALGSARGLAVQSSQKTVLKSRSSNNSVWDATPSKGNAKLILPTKAGNDTPHGPVSFIAPGIPPQNISNPRISTDNGRNGGGTLGITQRSIAFSSQFKEASKKRGDVLNNKTSLKPNRPDLSSLSSNTRIPMVAPSPGLNKLTVINNSTHKISNFRMEEPIPDIELPAGRTWKQQLEYDLKEDDNDMASTSSIDDLLMESLGSRSMWDDWKESMRKHHREEGEKLDRYTQKEIDAMLEKDQRDYERGIESLCDIVDGFGVFGSDDEIDLLLVKDDSGDDDDDDEWSLPASSLCGPGADDSFFKL
jgi:hypothetical protein